MLLARVRASADAEPGFVMQPVKPMMPPLPRTFWGLPVKAALAAAVLIIGLGITISSLLRAADERAAQAAALTDRVARLQHEIERQREIVSLLTSPQVRIINLIGQQPNRRGHGTIIWDPARKEAFFVTNLPPPPAGRDYQLWQIVNDEPESILVFSINARGDGTFEIRPVDIPGRQQSAAFAVSLEPKGGVPQPTGEIHLLGETRL